MDIKKQSHVLKKRAKELGYEIKLTHAQEIVARLGGHETRHSALKENKSTPEGSLPKGMIINTQCQICNRRPRAVAHYIHSGNPQIWLLCKECINPASRFSIEHGAKDVSDRYDLKATYLRDVMFENGDHSPTKKAFMFRLICLDGSLGDRYMFMPGLWSGHSECKVWNMDQNKEANGWWDWSIIVLPSP